jgi:hypothetical protein
MNKRAHLATFILGATAGIIAAALYARSGRQWDSDAKEAQDWFDARANEIRRTIGGGKKAVDRALEKADRTADRLLDSARSAAQDAGSGLKSSARKARKALD